jgi:FAD:protein FMN transferase
MKTFQFRAMNSDILLAAEGKADQVEEGFERARQFVDESEARFSRFSDTSELSDLNRSAGRWFQASPDFFTVVALAQRFFHITRGLFDPSILPNLRRVGYDKSMDLLRNEGSTPLFESLLAGERHSFSEIDLDETSQKIRLPAGMSIDLGGIAKGWIAEQAAIVLSGYASPCLVNAGGDMFLIGLPEGETHWPVELEDPFQPENTLTVLRVDPGAVATSAVTKRVWTQGDKSRHHLIDPRTGEPAVTEWVSVTVLADHSFEAEVFAKALLIAGPLEADNFIRSSGIHLSYVAVDHERKLWNGLDPSQDRSPILMECANVH